MEKFVRHTGRVIPINRVNVDTDAIMPKQYLKCISKFGYGDWLFDSWRYLDPGDVDTPTSQRRTNPYFELNNPNYKSASILLAQNNFGCGSSREHAVWGLRDYGIKVVISPGFPDIFFNNCIANGLLPIKLKQQEIDLLFDLAESNSGVSMTIDLTLQHIELEEQTIKFEIDEDSRQNLIEGYDSIEATLQRSRSIIKFEHHYFKKYSWLEVDLKQQEWN